jgi:prepilin-type processing-associated H-X9-DG protein
MTTTARPLRVAVFVSSTGGNLNTLLRISEREPDLFQVCIVISHSPANGAVAIAERHHIRTWRGDFDKHCGLRSAAQTADELKRYRDRARTWHDEIDKRLLAWECVHGDIDLVVLAYHRLIEGQLLRRYSGRMINVHPGDLTILTGDHRRLLVGMNPVGDAISAGHPATRTSCFMVDNGIDTGPILCRGPAVAVEHGRFADDQEALQKIVSDPVALEWTVRAMAARRISFSSARHLDGSNVVLLDGHPMPFGGKTFDVSDADISDVTDCSERNLRL